MSRGRQRVRTGLVPRRSLSIEQLFYPTAVPGGGLLMVDAVTGRHLAGCNLSDIHPVSGSSMVAGRKLARLSLDDTAVPYVCVSRRGGSATPPLSPTTLPGGMGNGDGDAGSAHSSCVMVDDVASTAPATPDVAGLVSANGTPDVLGFGSGWQILDVQAGVPCAAGGIKASAATLATEDESSAERLSPDAASVMLALQ
jgi:hypothetical protein